MRRTFEMLMNLISDEGFLEFQNSLALNLTFPDYFLKCNKTFTPKRPLLASDFYTYYRPSKCDLRVFKKQHGTKKETPPSL